MPRLDNYTNASPDAADDEFLFWDTSAGAAKNATRDQLESAFPKMPTADQKASFPSGASAADPLIKASAAATAAQGAKADTALQPTDSGSGLTGLTSSQIAGTTTNDNAASGKVGEHVTATRAYGSAQPLSSGISASITSMSITAGDWDIDGAAGFTLTSATVSLLQGGASTTNGVLDTTGSSYFYNRVALSSLSGVGHIAAIPAQRISVAVTTTVYLVVIASFSGTVSAYGHIRARRVR